MVLILRGEYRASLVWFAAAAITDALDGWLARLVHAESPFGQVLDPVADKVLLSGAFAALAIHGDISWWIAGLVLGRDALILLAAGAFLAFSGKRRSFPPSIWGKLSTIAQCIAVLAVILVGAGFKFPAEAVLWATAALTAWSGLDYFFRLSKKP